MNVLILGAGAREHALAWKIAQSPLIKGLFIAPGNAGTQYIGKNLAIEVTDFESILNAIKEHDIELVLVGPEAPLVEGIVDFLREQSPRTGVIGPSAVAAQLEGSKEFAKQFMDRHGIPTAPFRSFTKESLADGLKFLESIPLPYVLKADGLAGGKGVLILEDLEEAKSALTQMLQHKQFGKASEKVVVESYLDGIELSCFALTDGKNYVILPEAKDYKRIGEGDKGLNTGGMGAISPVPFVDEAFRKKVEERIIKPTIEGIRDEGMDYKGFVFFGLMKVGDDPFVIEYNVRMGDPETEVVIPRIESDLLPLLVDTARRQLEPQSLKIREDFAVTIMAVSGGYPGSYDNGKIITGLDHTSDSLVFHAGTTSKNRNVVSSGGRVLAVTAIAPQMSLALDKAYSSLEKISFEKMYYRKDIGFDL